MSKRREFIVKSLAGVTGIVIGRTLPSVYALDSFEKSIPPIKSNPALTPVVEKEEAVYSYVESGNGAGPLWCKGSTCLTRIGSKVFATGLETIADLPPLNNCRWMLLERLKDGWKRQLVDYKDRTREPSLLASFQNGTLLLSNNPSLLTDPKVYSGPARPEVLLFKASNASKPKETLLPAWADNPKFTEHSYRSLAADGEHEELILFQNVGDLHCAWSFRDASGKWSAQGRLEWPWGKEYEHPEPIRICYPNVMLKNRKVYFFGVSDIIEPKKAWRDYKKQITGKDWDYDFRRLFITWSDDITTGKFHPWIEVASREATGGGIDPCDLWISPDGSVHLLWHERALDERLREKFFPNAKQSQALNYAVLRDSEIITRRTLTIAEEGGNKEIPGSGRFQITPDNRLLVVYYVRGSDASGKPISENRLLELSSDGLPGTPVRLPLKQPFTRFFNASVRSGSKPSNILDMFGAKAGGEKSIHYARIKLI